MIINQKKAFVIDTGSNLIYYCFKFLTDLVVFYLLINNYGLQQYGTYIFFFSLIAQFEFIQNGFSLSLSKYLPDLDVIQAKTERNNLIGLVSIIYFTASLGILFFLYIAKISGLFTLVGVEESKIFLLTIFLLTPILWLLRPFESSLKGSLNYRSLNTIKFFTQLAEMIFIYCFVKSGISIELIFLGVFLINVIRYVSICFYYSFNYGFNFSDVNSSQMIIQFKKIKRFSFWNFSNGFSSYIVHKLDDIFLSIFLGATALPIYKGIKQFYNLFVSFNSTLNGAIIPYFANKLNSHEKFNHYIWRGLNITLPINFFLGYFIFFNSHIIIGFLSKEHLLDYDWILKLGLLILMFLNPRNLINKLHISKGDHVDQLAKISIIHTISFPVLLFFSIKYFDIEGALITNSILHLIILPIWVNKILNKTNLGQIKYFKIVLTKQIQFFLPILFLMTINYFLEISNLWVLLFENICLISIFIFQIINSKNDLLKILNPKISIQ